MFISYVNMSCLIVFMDILNFFNKLNIKANMWITDDPVK